MRVLGAYVPSAWQSEIIETEIRAFLDSCCRAERVSVRIPMGIPPALDNLQWHHDGGGVEGTTRHMVVWASEQPTELRGPDGDAIETRAYDVIWFNNDACWHRQPAGTDASRRWFVAVRCSGVIA